MNAGGFGVFPATCLAHLLMAARVCLGSTHMCYSLSICPQVIIWKSTEGKKLQRNLAQALSSFMVLVATWAWDTTRVMRQLDTTACWCSRKALITRYHLQCGSPQDLTHSCLAVCNLPNVTANCSCPQDILQFGACAVSGCDSRPDTILCGIVSNIVVPSHQPELREKIHNALIYLIFGKV